MTLLDVTEIVRTMIDSHITSTNTYANLRRSLIVRRCIDTPKY